jgi:DNA invertase Pin-like site-specific DNA recombinase
MNCGLYVRVSTSKQETENQLGQLRDFAASVGWQVVVEYVDQLTGKTRRGHILATSATLQLAVSA